MVLNQDFLVPDQIIQLGYPPSRIDVISTPRPQDLADLENLQ
jgi:hypothetical protein